MAAPVQAASLETLHKRQTHQLKSLHRWTSALTFFRNHEKQAHSKIGRREIRRAKVWVRIIRRELAETRAGLRPRYPWSRTWLAQATCIHGREGAWNANTGNSYYGGFQFLLSTWRSVGGQGYPHLASPQEQLLRAYMVWKRDGGSWMEWGTAGMCGLA